MWHTALPTTVLVFLFWSVSYEVMSGAELYSSSGSDVDERDSSLVVFQTSSGSGLESEDEDWAFDQQGIGDGTRRYFCFCLHF